MPMLAWNNSSSGLRPRSRSNGPGMVNSSSSAGSLGFSWNRMMRRSLSLCMMPKSVAAARLTGTVPRVISAPLSTCCLSNWR